MVGGPTRPARGGLLIMGRKLVAAKGPASGAGVTALLEGARRQTARDACTFALGTQKID